jgi:hypothetical protein
MNLPPMLQGDSLTRLLQGAAAGCAITLVLGFGWGGWQLQSKAESLAQQSVNKALVAALAPICVDKFQHASDAKTTLAALKATDSWNQDTFVAKGGWATFPGSEPNSMVAEACARMLSNAK